MGIETTPVPAAAGSSPPPEIQAVQLVSPDVPAIVPGAAPGSAQSPPLDAVALASGASLVDGNVVIPADAYRSLMERASQVGRQEFETSLQPRLTALGFDNLAEFMRAVEEEAAKPPEEIIMATAVPPASPAPAASPAPSAPAPPAAAVAPTSAALPFAPAPSVGQTPPAIPGQPLGVVPPDPGSDRTLPEAVRKKMAQIREASRREVLTAQQQATTYQQQVQQYESQLAALRAESAMKLELVQLGISDLDVAWALISKQIQTLGADQTAEGKAKLGAFAAASWVEEQRKTRPFLFGQLPVPAQTGAPTGAAPPAPQTPASVAGAAAAAGAFDGRTASAKEFQDRMRAQGIDYRGSGPPMRS